MKRLPEDPKQSVEEMYNEIEQFRNTFYSKINKIDIYDNFTLTEMRMQIYFNEDDETLNEQLLLNDIQRILAFIDASPSRYVIKEVNSDSNCNCLVEITPSECQKKFTSFKISFIDQDTGKRRRLKVWDFIQNNLKFIAYKQVQFYSSNPQIFSMFRGFPFKRLENFDLNIIQKFLEHMRCIICNENDECYDYMVKWLSFIFRHPGEKT